MDPLLVLILVGIPVAWLIGFAAYAYVDAPKHGMDPRKWAAISFFIPFFGFFAYLFEREEQYYDPSEDPYAQRTFNVHESRQDEAHGPKQPETDEREQENGSETR